MDKAKYGSFLRGDIVLCRTGFHNEYYVEYQHPESKHYFAGRILSVKSVCSGDCLFRVGSTRSWPDYHIVRKASLLESLLYG